MKRAALAVVVLTLSVFGVSCFASTPSEGSRRLAETEDFPKLKTVASETLAASGRDASPTYEAVEQCAGTDQFRAAGQYQCDRNSAPLQEMLRDVGDLWDRQGSAWFDAVSVDRSLVDSHRRIELDVEGSSIRVDDAGLGIDGPCR